MTFEKRSTIDPEIDLILPFRKDKVDDDRIFEICKTKNVNFEGNFAESTTLYSESGRKIYLLGLGEEKDQVRIKDAFQQFTFSTKKYWSGKIQLDAGIMDQNDVELAVLGIQMAHYNIGIYKSEQEEKDNCMVLVISSDAGNSIDSGRFAGETINSIRSLIDAPANVKTPEYMAQWAKESAAKYKYNCEIKDKEQLEKEGFGALLAVGSGSVNEARLITVSHTPKDGEPIEVGLVGKGITFDSGGLSIKPAHNLHYLKSDMGGAAAVLGAVELAAKLNLKVNITGVVACAENAVDSKSFRPSDVIHSYSGKTIEIIDTDAEGRLVLADALSYLIRTHKPEYLIDLATLTGSVVRTLGYSAAGLFSTNKDLADRLQTIGDRIHERVWPFPMYEDYEKDLHSDIADLRNFSMKPITGAISAAKFLEAFTENHENWVHLDIAGVAFGDSDYSKLKSATGYGVRLITEFIKSLEN